MLSDRKALLAVQKRLRAEGHAFGSLVEEIVMSSQFQNKRIGEDTQDR
jgi:hypothetical protein